LLWIDLCSSARFSLKSPVDGLWRSVSGVSITDGFAPPEKSFDESPAGEPKGDPVRLISRQLPSLRRNSKTADHFKLRKSGKGNWRDAVRSAEASVFGVDYLNFLIIWFRVCLIMIIA
jgi:hypothetical protein